MKCCWSCHRDTPLLRPTLNTGFLSGVVQTRRAISHEASWVGTRLPSTGAPWTPETCDTEAKSIISTSFGTMCASYKDWEQRGKTKSSWFPLMLLCLRYSRESAMGRREGRGRGFLGGPGLTHGDTYYGAVDGVQVVGDGLPRPRH